MPRTLTFHADSNGEVLDTTAAVWNTRSQPAASSCQDPGAEMSARVTPSSPAATTSIPVTS
ncbi:MAG: hypothetical protein M5U19_08105 [Microthrixaceae bacterium]|nr:hypothetical protein [Microthrixaceae bacterium]